MIDKRWKKSGEAWPSLIDQIQYSQVQLDRRWEFRVRLRHDSLTPNLEILIFSSRTEGKKSYLWEAFRQNRERCGRICFCQRGSCSTTCLCSVCVSTQSQLRVVTWKTFGWETAHLFFMHNHLFQLCRHTESWFWMIQWLLKSCLSTISACGR